MNSNLTGHHRETSYHPVSAAEKVGIAEKTGIAGKTSFRESRHVTFRKSTRAHEEWVKLNHLNGTRPFSAWSRHKKHDPL